MVFNATFNNFSVMSWGVNFSVPLALQVCFADRESKMVSITELNLTNLSYLRMYDRQPIYLEGKRAGFPV